MTLRERMHAAESSAIATVLHEATLSELLEDIADVFTAGGGNKEVSDELRRRAQLLRRAVEAYGDRQSALMLFREIGEVQP